MGHSRQNEALFQQVRALLIPEGKYVLFGSAPMGIRGLHDCHDLDVLVMEDVWNKYRDKGWEVRSMPNGGSEYLQKDGIELWKDWKPGMWDVAKLIKKAEVIDGLPFVSLASVVEWKRKLGRPKDLQHVEVIEHFLQHS